MPHERRRPVADVPERHAPVDQPRVRLLIALALLAASLVSRSRAEPEPAELEGRLVETLHGITIEYSPGQEPYLEPLAEGLAKWREEFAAQRKTFAGNVLPLSADDFVMNRDELLQDVATAIGLDAPTSVQEACFDTFANYYAALAEADAAQRQLTLAMADAARVALWRRGEIVERLKAGQVLKGFNYDAAQDKVEFALVLTKEGKGDGGEGGDPAEEMEAARLDHALHYEVKDGVANLTGRFTFRPGEARRAKHLEVSKIRENMHQLLRDAELVFPVAIEKDGIPRSPEDLVANEVAARRDFAAAALRPPQRHGQLALVVLHETAEIGLVDRYIGSANRRWICDGTANYVAWSIARRRAGESFARDVYDLPAQLVRHAGSQRKIRLSRWRAVERLSEEERNAPLDRAHYAYATRAVARMVEEHGEDFVAKLWREVGKTPRQKVSMKTVEAAYRKLTGDRLSSIIRYAEKTPIPVAPAP